MKRACFPRPGTSTVRVYINTKNGIFPRFFLQKMTSQQSVNTKSIACFPSSLFFVIIKRDFITDYLRVPAFTPEFLVRAQGIRIRNILNNIPRSY